MVAGLLQPGSGSGIPTFGLPGLVRQTPPRTCCLKPWARQLPTGSRGQQFGGHAAVASGVALLLAARAAASSTLRSAACRRPSRRRPLRIFMASQQTESGAVQFAVAEVKQMEEAEHLLRDFFGHGSWRCEQQAVVKAVVQKQDVLVNWSTGAGKSLCYQLPAVLAWRRRRGVTVVVEPLISLMRDQVVNFNKLSVSSDSPKATFLGSGQSDVSMDRRALEGEFCLVYVTPEKLTEGLLLGLEQLYKSGRLELIVMDEAACISLWGHDFRPSFRNMWWVREQHPQVPFMAVSASMTEDMRRDISEQLCLRDPFVSTLPYFRANLDITCTHKEGFANDMARIAEAVKLGEPMIVYTPMPSTAAKVATKLESLLQDQAVQVGVYTGATDKGERERVQSAFDKGEVQLLVATVAFGMGIDKPDIRKIIHYGIPKCMEDYHQQIGRAGRDGLPSSCVILFDNSEKLWFSKLFTKGYENWDQDDLRNHLESAEHLHQLVVGHSCRHESILAYFGREAEIELLKSSRSCRCDVCLGRRGEWLGSAKSRDFFREARLVLEAVRVAQWLTKGNGASKETVLKLVIARTESRLAGVPKIMVERLRAVRDELPLCRRTKAYVSEIFDMLYGDGYLSRQLPGNQDFRSFVWKMSEFGESALSWGRSVQLLPTRSMRKLELKREERAEMEQAQKEYDSIKKQVLKRVPCYLAELRNSSSEVAPNDESNMWDWMTSMTDSMKEYAVKAGESVDMCDNVEDEDIPKVAPAISHTQVASDAITGMASCDESVCTLSTNPIASICSDLEGVSDYNHTKLLRHVLSQHLQRTTVSCDVAFDYSNYGTAAQSSYRCVIKLPSLQGVTFSSGKAYPSQAFAKRRATLNALIGLLQVPLPALGAHATPIPELQCVSMVTSGGPQSKSQPRPHAALLLACMAQYMQRPPRSRDVACTFLLDSHGGYRCVVTLRALGGLQFSTKRTQKLKGNAQSASITHACTVLLRAKTGYTNSKSQVSHLLASLAKHMQRCPVDEDVEFRYMLDSGGFYTCIITVPALCLEFSTPKPQLQKCNAKFCAILFACKELTTTKSDTVIGNLSTKQESCLFACLAKLVHRPPVEQDLHFRYV
ncbi:unnamed protein product [Polarella glacialis]|uniref:DNA 3'-5' helicase n=2 Tax=Polarella glacialis TaxID=89957 RepID=A0A813IKG6_POLGL|nr:unnamed protein product [Polarella glacialis]